MLSTDRTSTVFAGLAMVLAIGFAGQARADRPVRMKSKAGAAQLQVPLKMSQARGSGSQRVELTDRERIEVKGSTTFYPPKVRGDSEFGGNGPEITIRNKFFAGGRHVYAQVFMRAAETSVTAGWFTSKPSVAEGWSDPVVVYTAPKGWSVKPFRTVDHRFNRYTDRSHSREFRRAPWGLLFIYGDTKGEDIGRYTRVDVVWNTALNVTLISDPR